MTGWPYPLTVAGLFVVVVLRAGSTYGIGRAMQAGARRTRLSRWLASPSFARARRLVDRWGAPVVVLSFLTVGLQTVVNLAAGVGRMPLRRYGPALAVGSVLWAFLYASVGFASFAALRQLYARSPVGAVLVSTILGLGLVAYVVRQVRRRAREQDDAPVSTAEG